MRTAILASIMSLSASAASAQTVVTLKAPDGTALKGTYYAAPKAGPGLVLLHQCNRDRTTWGEFAKLAASSGYHVITMDYRGYGESEGTRFTNFQESLPTIAEKWPADVDAALAWLSMQPGVDKARIGAAGASCGVNQAVLLARRHPEVRTLALLSGVLTPEARTYLRQSPALPVFAAASVEDGDTVNTMRWFLGWSRDPRNTFIELKSAGHGTDMFAVEKGLQTALLQWFDTTLRNAPTTASSAAAAPQGKPSPVEEFWTALQQPGGAVKAREIYDAAKSAGRAGSLFPEGEMNAYGYQMIQSGRGKEAIVAFQMMADAYPRSANACDSLADAYLADGNTTEALRLAEKALDLLSKDTAMSDQLRGLIRASAQGKVDKLKK